MASSLISRNSAATRLGKPIDRPRAIIVGSGAGGGTAARVLTQRGFDVVVLEKGPYIKSEEFLPFDELHFLHHKELIPHVTDDPNTHGDQSQRVERWWEANMVGGSTMIWDANFPRYTAEDFAVLSVLKDVPAGCDMVNWPWKYKDWYPWFERAEREWGVAGKARQCASQEEVRDGYEYPMPPLAPHPSTGFLMHAFGKAGMQPYHGPRAINSRTYDGRPACSFCGYNQFFGCTVNSRASALNTVLRMALETGRCDLRTNHYVTRILHENGQVRGVAYKTERSPTAPEHVLEAGVVFVSVQTIQSARLFLLSQIPDPDQLIGRYLTYHTRATAELTFKLQPVWDFGGGYQPRTAIGSLQLRDLYVIKGHEFLSKGGKFSIYDPYTCSTPLRLLKGATYGRGRGNIWGRELKQYMEELRTQGGVYFSFTGDAMSVRDNRVELDPAVKDPWGLPVARTFYQHHAYDIRLSEYALQRVCDIMADAGGEVRRFEPQQENNSGYGHVHGSLRAGTDPGTSVLDADCQCHRVKNLYVLDAAFMPTAGASNPSVTLLANAYRVCESVPIPEETPRPARPGQRR
jgi:choline dehydrogenase-like flavoprotein